MTAVDVSRSARMEVRNPVLGLPAAQEILALGIEIRAPLGRLLRELAAQADAKSKASWAKRKAPMFVYWYAIAVYARHIARAVDPASRRTP